MNSKSALIAAVLTIALSGCAREEAGPAPVTATKQAPEAADATGRAAAMITDEYLRPIIAELADDKYEGRGPGTRGDVAARDYMIEELKKLGLEPGAADGGWQQTFDLVGVNAAQPESWTFGRDGESLVLDQWEDFIVSSGVQAERAAVSDAEIVFVGYGIRAPEHDWDDYKGADLRGKVLLMMNNDPDWDPELFAGETRLWYGRWDYKYLSAARQGAAGAIIIHTSPSAGYPFQVVQTSWTGEQFELPAGDEPRTQIKAWVTEDAARELVAMAGLDLDELRQAAFNRDFAPVPLGVTTSIAMDVSMSRVQTANVLGLIRGGDPELNDEVVIYTAHHDHLGIGTPDADGDTIYNGAKDNATGVAQLLAIARAFKAQPSPPRRSILLALVGAEEQGLLGSQWYAENPTFSPGRIAANINYDSGNINGRTRDVTFIGFGKSSLDAIVTEHAARQGRVVKPDQYPDKGYFYRSDQFNFAKIGVPAAYLDPGTEFVDRPPGWGRERQDLYTERHYHQPSDEYDAGWNLDGLLEDAVLGYYTGLTVADADDMPHWQPGDEFEAARLEALAAED